MNTPAGGPHLASYMYAVEPPTGAWAYVLDSTGIKYRRGLVAFRLREGQWPYAADDPKREHSLRRDRRVPIPPECGAVSALLVPDTDFRSWGNEAVRVEPSREVPHHATAHLNLWVRRDGGMAKVTRCRVLLDLLNGTTAIEGLHPELPAKVHWQAQEKAAKLSAYFAAEVRNRDGDLDRPVTAAEHAEHLRHQPGQWRAPSPAHGRPCWSREVGDGVRWLIVVERPDGASAWAVCRHDREGHETKGDAPDAQAAMNRADEAVGARCPKCGRPRFDWPLERGNHCAPKRWAQCIRPT